MTHSVPRTRGRLGLAFAKKSNQSPTILRVRTQEPPLRVVRAFRSEHADGAALAHVHNLSGGVLGGDDLELAAEIGRAARAQITSTGATRVYRHRDGLPIATQRTHFQVHAQGLLEYLPDPLIPFARSRYRQETTIELGADAGLFYWELIAPGREASQEVFAFDQLHLKLRIAAMDHPIALEQFTLEPAHRPPTTMARMGSHRYLATFYICRVGVAQEQWRALEAELMAAGQGQTLSDDVHWGVSTLPAHGLVVRGLGHTGRTLSAGLLQMWQTAKRALYGEEAILPRKVY